MARNPAITVSLPQPGWQRNPWMLTIPLFAISFVYRLWFMNDGLFHPDEVVIARAVENSMEHLRLFSEVNGRYGTVLLNLLLYIPYKIATGGNAEKVVVFSSILTGALAIPALFLLARELTCDTAASAMAALFFNFNFLYLTTSTTGKETTHLAFFLTAAFLLILSGIKRESCLEKHFGYILFAFSLTVYEAAVPFIPIVLILILSANHIAGKRKKAFLAESAVFLGIATVPFLLYMGEVILRTLTVKNPYTASFDGIFSSNLPFALDDMLVSTGPLLLLFVPGIFVTFRDKLVFPFLSSWALLFFYFGNISLYTARYLVLIVVPMAIAGGLAASRAAKITANLWARWAIGALILIVVCGYGIYRSYPIIHLRKSYSGPKQAALYVRDHTEPEAVILTMDEAPFVEYYAKRKVMQHPLEEELPNRAFVEDLKKLAIAGTPVYINDTAPSYDHEKHFRNSMYRNFIYVAVGGATDEESLRSELTLRLFPNNLYRLVPR